MNTMKHSEFTPTRQWGGIAALLIAAALAAGCGGGAKKNNSSFFTSGNREADQRASQRMAQAEQLAGTGEGAGEKDGGAGSGSEKGGTNKAARVQGKLALYDRLGAAAGISNIVENFTPRVLDDPRVNWSRKGVKRGLFGSGKSEQWAPTPHNVAVLKQHLSEFLVLATGGPPHYTGGDIKTTHANMRISNPEFDAVMGDLKASLDKLKIANREQKELLAIVESTRPQIVTER